jgi:NAD kinase
MSHNGANHGHLGFLINIKNRFQGTYNILIAVKQLRGFRKE